MSDDLKKDNPVEETKEDKGTQAAAVEATEVKEEKKEVSAKFKDLIEKIENLSALELAELVKELEDRFGVSAAAPVAIAANPAAGGDTGEEEKSAYNVVLKDGGSNKIAAIKAVREVCPDLGLKEAKDLVEAAPKTIKENVPKEDAEAMKAKFEEAGAILELQ